MSESILGMCYEAIFDGLPVMRLRNHQNFMWDHDTHAINSLGAFRDNFETVMQMFLTNNFAEEYRNRLVTEPDTFAPHYSNPLERHSASEIERYFRALCDLINNSNPEDVEAQIVQLFIRHYGIRTRFLQALRALILPPDQHPHTARAQRRDANLSTPPPTENASLAQLLARMHSLARKE